MKRYTSLSQLSIFHSLLATACISISSFAQDESVVILQEADVAEATRPTVPADVEVHESHEIQLPDRKVTLKRISAPPAGAFVRTIPETAAPESAPAEVPLNQVLIVAKVYDQRLSLLTWWHQGSEYQAWSHTDWRLVAHISAFKKGDKEFAVNQVAAIAPSAAVTLPPEIGEAGSYHLIKGDPNAEALEAVSALHELYRADFYALKTKFGQRQEQRRLREEEGDETKDVTVHFWKAQKPRQSR